MNHPPLDLLAYVFWKKVGPPNERGCRLWKGCKPGRYGRFQQGPEGYRQAHRYAYLIHHGQVPDGLFVCHHCDTPACVEPSHLFAGTCGDNVRDMVAKGRHRGGINHRSQMPAAPIEWDELLRQKPEPGPRAVRHRPIRYSTATFHG